VSIIGGIVEQGLSPRIANTDFDARGKDLPFESQEDVKCCVFLEGISNSTKKLHQVLNSLLPPDHLQDVFSRIFAYLDENIPILFIAATSSKSNGSPSFQLPTTDDGKRRFVLEVLYTTQTLNSLSGVHPWDFTAMTVLERKMDYKLPHFDNDTPAEEPETTPEDKEQENATESVITNKTMDGNDAENVEPASAEDNHPEGEDSPMAANCLGTQGTETVNGEIVPPVALDAEAVKPHENGSET
jgi:hypothetical protein